MFAIHLSTFKYILDLHYCKKKKKPTTLFSISTKNACLSGKEECPWLTQESRRDSCLSDFPITPAGTLHTGH